MSSSSAKRLVLSDGRTLAWREYGAVDSGWPCVFFHGNLNSRMLRPAWGQTASAASSAGVRIIAVDRPGYGESTVDPWPRTYSKYANVDIKALAHHLKLTRFSVMGFSSGGPHAMACACELQGIVSGLFLVSSDAPYLDMGSDMVERLYGKPPPLDDAYAEKKSKETEALLRAAYESMRSAEKREMALEDLDHALRQGLLGPSQDARLETSKWGHLLSGIATPAVAWHGTCDADVPLAAAKHIAANIPSCDLKIIEGESHSLIRRQWPSILDAVAREGRRSCSNKL